MGMSSWLCSECKDSIKASNVGFKPELSNAVVVFKDSPQIICGVYDGYGRLGSYDSLYDDEGTFEIFHRQCWEDAGRPFFRTPAEHAHDQGCFEDEEDEEDDEEDWEDERDFVKGWN
jgi:hypothetical protein